ncbi:MAG TPA: hypothetical protein VGM92_04835 [Candidatus Kapabacteria bacterium]|jgi:hypothetical protein
MDRFLQDISIPRDTVRVNLTGEDFLAQLANIKDDDALPLLDEPTWKGITKRGEGFGVNYPTARIAFIDPKPEILPEGFQKNLFTTLVIELLFRFRARDEDEEREALIQREANSLATYVWTWLEPNYSDNPNGLQPLYPDIWRWNDKSRAEQTLDRDLIRIDKSRTGMTGSLYATHLYAPLIVFNPTVPYPIPS